MELVKAGCCNLQRHVENCTHFGVPVVVAVNKFVTDTDNELEAVRQGAIDAGAAPLLCVRVTCAACDTHSKLLDAIWCCWMQHLLWRLPQPHTR